LIELITCPSNVDLLAAFTVQARACAERGGYASILI
jgi:hypothetical protein